MADASDPIDDVPAATLIKRYAVRAGLAIAASLGLAGLVALLGAGILYVRLRALEVPADQALSVIENGELVVFGAVSSVLFVVLGAAAVVLVYLIDRAGRATRGMAIGLILLVATAMIWAVAVSEDVPGGWKPILFGLLIVAWVLGGGLSALVIKPAPAPAAAPDPASPWRYSIQPHRPAPSPQPSGAWAGRVEFLRSHALKLALALAAAEIVVAVYICLRWPVLGAQIVTAYVLGAALLRIAYLTGPRFAPYGVAVFVGVSVFAGIANAIREFEEPVASPVAVVRKGDDAGLCGLYVAETAKRVYVARTRSSPGRWRPDKDSGRLFWVARDTVVGMSIGDLQRLDKATRRAPQLARELLDYRVPEAPAAAATEKYTITTRRRVEGKTVTDVAQGTRPRPAEGGQGASGGGEEQERPKACAAPPPR